MKEFTIVGIPTCENCKRLLRDLPELVPNITVSYIDMGKLDEAKRTMIREKLVKSSFNLPVVLHEEKMICGNLDSIMTEIEKVARG